jgi:hypothetical protein
MSWSSPTSFNEVCRRAGGRRHYNSWRRFMKVSRRRDVMLLLVKYGYQQGVQARIARLLGVSEATISRDVRAALRASRVCQYCGSYKPRDFEFMNPEGLSLLSVDQRSCHSVTAS